MGNQNASQGFGYGDIYNRNTGAGAGALEAGSNRVSQLLSRGTGLVSGALAYSDPFSSMAGNYDNLAGGYQRDRGMQLQANMQSAANKTALFSSIGKTIGQIGGAAMGAGGWGNLFKF